MLGPDGALSTVKPHTALTSATAASILFGPNLYPRYINWQITIANPDEARFYGSKEEWELVRNSVVNTVAGDLPDPMHFRIFMRRIRIDLYTHDKQTDDEGEEIQEPDPTILIVASLCGHAIHPGSPCRTVDVCPLCIMRQCVASLERISTVWRLLGGPYERPVEGLIQAKLYPRVRGLWRVEKSRWANLVWKFEEFAEHESQWEEQSKELGSEVPEVVQKAMSCMAALRVAIQSPFVVEGWDEEFIPANRGINARVQETEVSEPWTPSVAGFPRSPPISPKPVDSGLPLKLPLQDEFRGLQRVQKPDEIPPWTFREEEAISPIANDATVPPPSRSPSPSTSSPLSSASSIYAPSPRPPPSPSPPMTPLASSMGQWKRVTFAEDIIDLGRRPQSSFRRNSVTYEPGRYSSLTDSR